MARIGEDYEEGIIGPAPHRVERGPVEPLREEPIEEPVSEPVEAPEREREPAGV